MPDYCAGLTSRCTRRPLGWVSDRANRLRSAPARERYVVSLTLLQAAGGEIVRATTTGFLMMTLVAIPGWATEHGIPTRPTSCVVNDGEWFWNSDSLDIAIGIQDDWVSYVAITLHRPG